MNAFGGETISVKDNNGRDHTFSHKRISWKPSLQCWAIWASWVGHAVLTIEENEKRADALGVGRLRTYPMMGDYVVVHRGEETTTGFIRRLAGDAVEVTQRIPDARGRFHIGVNKAHLHWDDENGYWRARADARQEKR